MQDVLPIVPPRGRRLNKLENIFCFFQKGSIRSWISIHIFIIFHIRFLQAVTKKEWNWAHWRCQWNYYGVKTKRSGASPKTVCLISSESLDIFLVNVRINTSTKTPKVIWFYYSCRILSKEKFLPLSDFKFFIHQDLSSKVPQPLPSTEISIIVFNGNQYLAHGIFLIYHCLDIHMYNYSYEGSPQRTSWSQGIIPEWWMCNNLISNLDSSVLGKASLSCLIVEEKMNVERC